MSSVIKRATIPASDEEIEPWISIIHWPELFTRRVCYESRAELETYVPITCGNCMIKRTVRVARGLSADLLSADSLSSKKGKVFTGLCRVCANLLREYAHKNDATEGEKLPSGSIIHWTERERSRGVPVTCGGCGKKRFMLSPDPQAMTGLCDSCGRRKHISDEHLSSGSIIHWGERDPNNKLLVMVTCGVCARKRLAHRTTETGICNTCRRSKARWKVDDEPLPSGSIIHWGERSPDHRKKAMITCGQCDGKRMGWIPRGEERHGKFVGFCEACARQARINPDIRDGRDETLPSGSIIHWGECDPKNPKRAPVTCVICGEKRITTVQSRKGWTGICYKHRGAAAFLEVIRTVPQSGNGQKNDKDVSVGGRPTVSARRTAKAVDAIAVKWEAVKDNGLRYEAQLKSITQESLSPYIDDLKEIAGSSEVTYSELNKKLNAWFDSCRLKEIFPSESRPFKPFVKTVVGQLREGITKEKIFSELEVRRQPGQRLQAIKAA